MYQCTQGPSICQSMQPEQLGDMLFYAANCCSTLGLGLGHMLVQQEPTTVLLFQWLDAALQPACREGQHGTLAVPDETWELQMLQLLSLWPAASQGCCPHQCLQLLLEASIHELAPQPAARHCCVAPGRTDKMPTSAGMPHALRVSSATQCCEVLC